MVCKERKAHVYVHQIVLLAFVGPPPERHEVRHLDGDSLNNRLDNLTYGTRAQNIADAKRHGTFPMGADRPGAKLTPQKAIEIAKSTEPSGVIAERYGVGTGAVQDIRSGKTWADATEGHRLESYKMAGTRAPWAKLTEEQVLEIYNSSLPQRVLAKMFSVSPRLIWSIRNGKTWQSVTGA